MTNPTSIRTITAALTAATITLALASCTQGISANEGSATKDGQTTMRIAYLSTANYLTILKDEEYAQQALAPAQVAFKGPFNPTDAYAAVSSGAADASSTGTGHFIDLIADGQPWVAFALEYYDGDSQGIVAAPNSGIDTLRDLYGKTVALISKGGTGDYIIHQAFAHNGLDASRVREVEMSPSNFNAAFTSGQVDAIATFDQNLAAAMIVPGAKLLTNGKEYGSLNVSIHMVSKSFADRHPDLVRKMYAALRQASDNAQRDPSVITKAYEEFGASQRLVEQIAAFDVPEIRPIDADGLDLLERQARQYVDFGFIDKVPDLESAVIDCSQ